MQESVFSTEFRYFVLTKNRGIANLVQQSILFFSLVSCESAWVPLLSLVSLYTDGRKEWDFKI